MATVLTHMPTGNRYVLLGTGFGVFQSERPDWLLGSWSSHTSAGQHTLVCVCDAEGAVGWLPSSDILVESVDGVSPGEALKQ